MMVSNTLQRRKSRQLLESYYIENRNDIYPLQGYLLTINNTTQMKKKIDTPPSTGPNFKLQKSNFLAPRLKTTITKGNPAETTTEVENRFKRN
jgi:hypothetical protein